jgi:hypothetical protein
MRLQGVFACYYEYDRRKVTKNSTNISDSTQDEIIRQCHNYSSFLSYFVSKSPNKMRGRKGRRRNKRKGWEGREQKDGSPPVSWQAK